MIQLRHHYGNVYIRIMDTHKTFQYTLDKVLSIPDRMFKSDTGEWMIPKENLGHILQRFDNQIIWMQPISEIVEGYDIKSDLVDRHLKWESSDDFVSWKLTPYPYQKTGAHFLASRERAAVLDGVGLGKTPQCLAASQILMNEGKAKRTLVVTLKSIVRQWAKEVEKFTPYQGLAVYGTASRREKVIKGFDQRDDIPFLIINYELLRQKKFRELLKSCNFDVMILDEAQKIKTGVTDNFLNLKPSQTADGVYQMMEIPYRFIATATPVQSKPQEVWSLFHFVDPNILGNWNDFRERYCKYSPRFGITGGVNLGELHTRIAPYFIRRTKDMPEIEQQLPAVTHDHHFLEMTEEQEKIENVILVKLEELREKISTLSGGAELINGQMLSGEQAKEYYDGMYQGYLNFLVSVNDSPELLSMSDSNLAKQILNESGVKDLKKSPKLDELKAFITQLQYDEPNAKVVIFTKFERMARLIFNHLNSATLYTGQLSESEKEYSKNRFLEDPSVQCLVTTDALSTGANLQIAKHMIHVDLPYSPTMLEQRNGRIDRTGSSHPNIFIHYYVMADSYDEQLLEMLNKKAEQASEILTGSKESSSKGKDVNRMALERLMKKRAKSS